MSTRRLPKKLTDVQGRKFVQVRAQKRRKNAISDNAIYRMVPDDGHEYFVDLMYRKGISNEPIMMRFSD
jgi:hypothetical protein